VESERGHDCKSSYRKRGNVKRDGEIGEPHAYAEPKNEGDGGGPDQGRESLIKKHGCRFWVRIMSVLTHSATLDHRPTHGQQVLVEPLLEEHRHERSHQCRHKTIVHKAGGDVNPGRWIVAEDVGLIESDENIAGGIYWPLVRFGFELRIDVDDEGRTDSGEQTSLGAREIRDFEMMRGSYENQYDVEVFIARPGALCIVSRRFLLVYRVEV